MKRTLAILLVQVALAVCVILMGAWVEMPWLALVGLGLLSIGAVIADGLPRVRPGRRIRPWTLTSAWIGTFVAPGALFVATNRAFTLDI